MSAAAAAQAWEAFWPQFDALQASISKGTSTNVNRAVDREATRHLVKEYFQVLQPQLTALGFPVELVRDIDAPAQRLVVLASGVNVRSSYKKALKAMRKGRVAAEAELLLRTAVPNPAAVTPAITSTTEGQILKTLQALVPTAALSYEQGLLDLKGPPRVSYRGSATELREALRETLDHLAPDDEVKKQANYKPEKDEHGKERTKPTMRQKALFILKNRGSGSHAQDTSKAAITCVEEASATMARSVYSLGSSGTHAATEKQAAQNMKGYVDAVLADLLQVHKPK